MKGFCLALALLTVVLVTDVQSQEDECGGKRCGDGETCRFVRRKWAIRQQCIETSTIPKNGSPRKCGSSGQPLLVVKNNGAVKVFKVKGGKSCPGDSVRVKKHCCAGVEKEGQCPDICGFFGCPPVLPECENKCTGDNQCKGDKKCCRSQCVGTKCVDPVFPRLACSSNMCPQDVGCVVLECGTGETCVPQSGRGASCEPSITCENLRCEEGFACQELLPNGAECVDICELPRVVGRCRAAFPKWYYNSSQGACESFIYGGCGGNANNFENQESCAEACPKAVPR